MAKILCKSGSLNGQEFELTAESYKIGRDEGNDIVLTDEGISRNHAEIKKENDGYIVADLGSTNGTYVDEQKVTRHVLKNGQTVRLHTVEFGFVDDVAAGKEDSGATMVRQAVPEDAGTTMVRQAVPSDEEEEKPAAAPGRPQPARRPSREPEKGGSGKIIAIVVVVIIIIAVVAYFVMK